MNADQAKARIEQLSDEEYKAEFQEYTFWLKRGVERGWCSPIYCNTHDGATMTEGEVEEFEEGDPCIFAVRLYH